MKRTARCLAIEDSLFDQQKILRAASRCNLDVEIDFADTLSKGRAALAVQTYEMILLDNTLPDGRGIDLGCQLASDPRYRDVPIIMVSGWPSPFMWAKAAGSGLRVIEKNEPSYEALGARFREVFAPAEHAAANGRQPAAGTAG
ncbi:response regulator [Roseovarius faecimaris]|uniref:Response regulator n=1 Tax=Roseovarius faecimaris TaxID=2494550 RepID=A0A6I6IRL6_9RHOB|nr:response regulator [Roseovarius faecimaris]QGX98523.1 response regulator [Roseovarius faecimaris]